MAPQATKVLCEKRQALWSHRYCNDWAKPSWCHCLSRSLSTCTACAVFAVRVPVNFSVMYWPPKLLKTKHDQQSRGWVMRIWFLWDPEVCIGHFPLAESPLEQTNARGRLRKGSWKGSRKGNMEHTTRKLHGNGCQHRGAEAARKRC